MSLLKGFAQFAKRVLQAAKKGGLGALDLKKLANLLKRTEKRNKVMARGLLSALAAGGASEKDIKDLAELLRSAEDRILRGEEPFNEIEKAHISRIFKNAYISSKTERWFSNHMDELLAEEIREIAIDRRKTIVPKKTGKKRARMA